MVIKHPLHELDKIRERLQNQMEDELKSALYYLILAGQIPECKSELTFVANQEIEHFFKDWDFVNRYAGVLYSMNSIEAVLKMNIRRNINVTTELSGMINDEAKDSDFYYRTAQILGELGLPFEKNIFLLIAKQEQEHAEILRECIRKL